MSSPLTQLSDADLERVNHLVRRDASTDLEIAQEVERCLGKPIGPTNPAKVMVITRWRKGRVYQAWLKAWQNRDIELQRSLDLQRQRFEFISELVGAGPEDQRMETLSKSISARLLTLAAEADDKTLMEAAAGKGWIKTLLKVVQDQSVIERKAAGEKAVAVVQDTKLTEAEREARMKEIFGLA